ncbi:MAG: LexA family transcriptional regulator [Dehalococcoidia bacterium]|nr:LexA family transcriptional regulator [Dehalococcoidia bacterium]
MSLGEFVRKTREARGLTQHELAALSGLGRGYISLIELDRIQETSAEKILKLAKALRVKPEEIYQAAGYIKEARIKYVAPASIILDSLQAVQALHNIIEVPVVAELHMPGEIIEYAYIARPRPGPVNYVGVRAKGYCLEPEIQDGDVLIIDKDAQPEPGRTVLCYHNHHEQPRLIRYKKPDDLKDCEIYGVIVAINRKM